MACLYDASVYDQWVSSEIDFDSTEVRAAFSRMVEIFSDADFV